MTRREGLGPFYRGFGRRAARSSARAGGRATGAETAATRLVRGALVALAAPVIVAGIALAVYWGSKAASAQTNVISLTVSPSSLLESANSTEVTVTARVIGTAPATDVTVALSVDSSSTATSGTDYAALGTLSDITITASSTSGSVTVDVDPTEDTIDEGTGESIVFAGTASGGLTGNVSSDSLTITDNDTASTINLSTSPSSVMEGDSATAVTVTATFSGTVTRSVATEVTLNSTLLGTATGGGTDYSHTGLPTKVTIAAESSSGSATGLSITPADDSVAEVDETILIRGTATGLTVNSATITLEDNDDPTITLSSERVGVGDDDSVSEGESATFKITATRNTADKSAAVNVTLVVQAASTATSGTDYTALSSTTISIAPNAASGSKNVTVSTKEDRLNEGTGETIVLGATVSGFTVKTETITITDDDATSTSITLRVSDDSIGEDETPTTTVTVTAEVNDAAPTTAVAVALSLSGDAVAGTDYADPGTLTSITIAAGEVSGTSEFDVDPTDDEIDEDNETITVNGSATGGLTDTATVDITFVDDDTATLTLSTGATTSIGEGDAAATSVTVTATLDIARSKTTTVTLSLGGTAISGTDYSVPATLPSITISTGDMTGNASFSITPTEDRLDEGTGETIKISGAADGVTGGSASITLTDNDATSTAVTVTVGTSTVGEGDTTATSVTVTATLNDAAVKTETEMALTFAGGAADSDYSITPDSPKVTFGVGMHEASVTISVHPTHDLIDENDETIVVGVVTSLTVTTATITLTDDDTASSVTLTVDQSTVRELDGGTEFDQNDTGVATSITVTATIDDGITRLVDTDVTLSLTGTATKGTSYGTGIDYKVSASAPGSVRIGKGKSSGDASFTITPRQDGLTEGDETIVVGGTVTDLTLNSVTINLADDDSASTSLTLHVNNKNLYETWGNTTVPVGAVLDGGSLDANLVVSLRLGGDAAGGGVDYTLGESLPQITIPAGKSDASANIKIDPVDDRVDEGTYETLTVGGTATDVDVNGVTLRINDNDTASKRITLSVNRARVDEDGGASSVGVTATLAGNVTRSTPTEVLLTFGGTATLNTDYTAAPAGAKVIIAAESTTGTGTISITPVNNTVKEGNKTIRVQGAVAGFRVWETVITLVDDELTPPSAITDLTAQLQGRNAVRLSWTRPGPGPITRYRLERRIGGGTWATYRILSGAPTSRTEGGLAYNTGYGWRLYAVNADGEGPVSNEVTATTGSRPPPTTRTPTSSTPSSAPAPAPAEPEAPPQPRRFEDVKPGSALAPGIERAVSLGIMSGTGDDRFEPTRQVTRAEVAAPLAGLWRLLGGTCPSVASMPFDDLPSDGQVRGDVACLHTAGIISGRTAVTYSPDRVLNRAQTATLLPRMWRLTGRTCPDAEPPFTDVADDNVHRDGIACMAALGVTKGTTSTTFTPAKRVTRGQLAVLAARLHDAAKPSEAPTSRGRRARAPREA